MKVGASHLQAPSTLAGKLAKSPNQMATCGQITELPDSECIYDNKLFHRRERRWWANKSVQKCRIQKASGCLTGRRTPRRQLSINRLMGDDCCILQTAWSHLRVNGHLNERNQMDRKELTERKHLIAKQAVRMKSTDYKFQNKRVACCICKFEKMKNLQHLKLLGHFGASRIKMTQCSVKPVPAASLSDRGRAVIVIVWKVYVGADLAADPRHWTASSAGRQTDDLVWVAFSGMFSF